MHFLMTIKRFCIIKRLMTWGHINKDIEKIDSVQQQCDYKHNIYSSNMDHSMFIYTIIISKIMNSVIQKCINTASTDHDPKSSGKRKLYRQRIPNIKGYCHVGIIGNIQLKSPLEFKMNTLFTFVTISIPINSCKYLILKIINTVYK